MTAAVMGGGASGIMAAIAAAEEGADVILLERLDRVGKKILATGNGRCNITNMNVSPENYYSIGKSTGQTAAARKFAGDVIGRFGAENTLEFFDSIGVMTRAEDKGRVYPYTGQASSVLDALRFRMDVLGVKTICGFEARKIEKAKDGGFEIVSYSGERIRADKAVVACGGRSSPSLGSNGSGYDILKMLGHSVTEVYPSLVQIETDRSVVKGLAGIKKDCGIKILCGEKIHAEDFGEVLFTEYGLSGPPVFNLSAKLPHEKNQNITFRLDVMAEYTKQEIADMLFTRRAVMGEYRLEDFFVGFLNKKIIYAILKSVGVSPLSRPGRSITDGEIYALCDRIKNWDFRFIRTRGWNNSQVTKGGIPLDEVDVNMQSVKVKGIYITGELLDIDGDCGGYNLQWAWATGHIAGKALTK